MAHGATSLRYEQADEAQILTLVRGHWAIENSVHWVRDVTFREDASRIRTRHAPRVMATMRNLALSLLHRFAPGNIARATRLIARHPERALTLIGACPP